MPIFHNAFGISSDENKTEDVRALIPRLALPIIFKLIDHNESWVKIPAKIGGIPKKVCKRPVNKPARIPATTPNSIPNQKLPPLKIITAHTAPPVANDPSTVRSGISSTLYEMKTPNAMMLQIAPSITAPGSELKYCSMLFDFYVSTWHSHS